MQSRDSDPNDEREERRDAVRPERLFVWIALPFALFFALATPPHDPPDEVRHLARAYLIAGGEFGVPGRAPGRQLTVPTSLIDIHRPHGQIRLRHGLSDLAHALSLPLEPERRRRMLQMSLHTPFCYAPQAAAIAIGRGLELRPGLLLYLGRLANLLLWVTVGWWTIRVTPVRKWAFLLLCLTPMSLYQAGSLSSDAPSHCFALLWYAVVLRCAFASQRVLDWRGVALLVGAGALVGVGKAGYWPVLLLVLLIPAARFRGRSQRVLTLAGLGVASLLPSAVWALSVKAADPFPLWLDADPIRQLEGLMASPVSFFGILAETLAFRFVPWVEGMTGLLGQVDIVLPWPVYVLYPAAVLLSCGADPRDPSELSSRRLLLLTLFMLCSLCVLTLGYLAWTPVGSSPIIGIQGRYFLPIAPLVLLAVPGGWARGLALRPPWIAGFCVAVLAIAAYAVADHYYFL